MYVKATFLLRFVVIQICFIFVVIQHEKQKIVFVCRLCLAYPANLHTI